MSDLSAPTPTCYALCIWGGVADFTAWRCQDGQSRTVSRSRHSA